MSFYLAEVTFNVTYRQFGFAICAIGSLHTDRALLGAFYDDRRICLDFLFVRKVILL